MALFELFDLGADCCFRLEDASEGRQPLCGLSLFHLGFCRLDRRLRRLCEDCRGQDEDNREDEAADGQERLHR